MKQRTWKTYAGWILATEAVGALSALLTRGGMELYNDAIVKPPLSPPPIVFPIAWAILYALMGAGAARIWTSPPSMARQRGLVLYVIQLAFNFLWSIIFFEFEAFGLAFFWLLALWVLVLWMTLEFYRVDRIAAFMQIPYVLWLTFAAYLNFGVWMLNR